MAESYMKKAFKMFGDKAKKKSASDMLDKAEGKGIYGSKPKKVKPAKKKASVKPTKMFPEKKKMDLGKPSKDAKDMSFEEWKKRQGKS